MPASELARSESLGRSRKIQKTHVLGPPEPWICGTRISGLGPGICSFSELSRYCDDQSGSLPVGDFLTFLRITVPGGSW